MCLMSQWLPGSLLPIETLYFQSDIACIGRLQCSPDHPLFRDSGPVRNQVFVFPRRSLMIEHDSGVAPFIAGPNVIPLYNAGQSYSRRNVEPDTGVASDWFAVAPDVVLEIARRYDPTVESHPEKPFTVPFVPSPPELYARQRRIYDEARLGREDRVKIEEEVVGLLDSILELVAARRCNRGLPRNRRQYVEHAKTILALTLDRPVSLRSIARHTGVSVYYLCKIFHHDTGFTIHEYRQQLRLRRALDEVLSSHDLLETALHLGFNSHSHFTYAFRKAFGVTPSEFRKARVLPRAVERSLMKDEG
jgi:AraC family transcriptional regulator